MSFQGVRCVACLAALLAALCLVFSVNAYAADASAPYGLSSEFWVGLILTTLLALVAAYARGMETGFNRRIEKVEKQQDKTDQRLAAHETDAKQQWSAISLLSERVLREHPTRQETTEHREKIERGMERINDRLDELFERLGKR